MDLTVGNFSSKRLDECAQKTANSNNRQRVQSCYKMTPKAYGQTGSFMPNLVAHFNCSDEKSKSDASSGQNTILRNHSTMQKLKKLLIAAPEDAAEMLVKVVFELLIVFGRILFFACSWQDSSNGAGKIG